MDRRAFVVGALGVLAGAAFTEAQAAGEPVLALLSGHHWPGTVVSYGFPAAGFAWGSTYGSKFPGGFQPFTDDEKVAARRALQRWTTVSGGLIRLTEMAASKALVRFAFTTVSMGAMTGGATPMMGYTYYPGPGKGGDVWLSTGIRKYGFADGSYGFATLAHEIGHALGLKHPNEGRPVLASSLDYPANTIMSRRAYKGDPLTDGWGPDLPSYPIGPGPLDGRALALAY